MHRHFGRAEREKGYSIIKCTNWEVFCVRLACLENIDKEIVVSLIENFLCDDAKEVDKSNPDALDASIKKAVDRFATCINDLATRMPKTRIAIAMPMLRPAYPWYVASYEKIIKYYRDSILGPCRENMTVLGILSGLLQEFECDQGCCS